MEQRLRFPKTNYDSIKFNIIKMDKIMKKLLLLIALIMPMALLAQEKQEKEKSSSKTIEFLSKDGSFLIKEFYDLPKVGTSYDRIDCQVLIITDMKSNEKMGCFRLTTHYPSGSGTDDYIGTLDPDELDASVMCLEKIQSDILSTTPTVYTEAEFKTRDGVQIGTYWNKTKNKSEWVIYVKTKNYTSRSLSSVDVSNLPNLIQNLKDAKEMIVAKCK